MKVFREKTHLIGSTDRKWFQNWQKLCNTKQNIGILYHVCPRVYHNFSFMTGYFSINLHQI
jgi:hypothetical protein